MSSRSKTAIGGLLLSRQRQRAETVADLESEVVDLRHKFEAALRHIYALREDMKRQGHAPPDMPEGLTTRRDRRDTR
ncbi:hypothetical protein [Saccharopolyspora hattusasensis]|uniref:hypothetical protein n=1 Tax=Saccharopolyspora hattusasensis TaxID=1128679 RepID=UPI003D96FE03